MNPNDDKTILGESDFNKPNNEQNNQSAQNKQESSQKEYAKNTVTSKTDKNKVSKGAAIGGAAAVGVAAAVGGVAAGTAYSEEIKEKYNELFAEDTKAEAENTTEVTDTAEVKDTMEVTDSMEVTDDTNEETQTELDSDLSKTEDFVSTTHHSSNESEVYSDSIVGQDSEIRVELPPDEFGTVHAINLVDFDHDGVADKIEEITTINIPEWDEGGYLTSSGYEPDPNMIIEDEPLPEGYFEPEGMPDFIDPSLIDETNAYEPIDYANFEDGTIQPIDDAFIASDESVAGDYIIDPSITEDFTLDGELQSEDYSLDSDLTSDEFTASTEDYSLDSDLSSEDYLASNEDYSLNSDISSEDYLASNEDYQIELENTDFDSMDNTDFSSDSFDTGYSDDLI